MTSKNVRLLPGGHVSTFARVVGINTNQDQYNVGLLQSSALSGLVRILHQVVSYAAVGRRIPLLYGATVVLLVMMVRA